MKRRTHQEWRTLFEQQRSSGLTIKSFCLEHQLNPNYFSKRRSELETLNHGEGHSAFVRLQSDEVESTPIVVSYGRMQLQISTSVSPQWLAVLVKALA